MRIARSFVRRIFAAFSTILIIASAAGSMVTMFEPPFVGSGLLLIAFFCFAVGIAIRILLSRR